MTELECLNQKRKLKRYDELTESLSKLARLREEVRASSLAGKVLNFLASEPEQYGSRNVPLPVAEISSAIATWITQEEQRLTEELAKL